MKIKFQEDPREWRKSTLLTLGGLAFMSTLLRWWRHAFSTQIWFGILALLFMIAICAFARPRWFRGYYRLSLRLGFYLSQFVGRIVLALFFICILTPIGLALRLAGKDLLEIKRQKNLDTYWHKSREVNSLDKPY